ncbi:hypothetical protein LJ737_23840 [Hymenobacter sp. 15J16-1T3B]|uniref:hypothetical protein n=1 Tax=Hymenobacter sp. 15J16-1T3B TaxID=2886941 RepID=UPI001D11BF05|nr:hypothetical protein [Hymenobacter sp. 15J16-1T3B]MCC3160290.1 hypothetical protein [Hymenobacter sp. 15J16-1T3B]
MERIAQLQALVNLSIPAFAAPNADDNSVLQFLLDQGTDLVQAQQVVAFAPLAFGRAVLAQLPIVLSTTSSIVDDRGNVYEGYLLELEPVFVAAQWLAEELIERRQWREDEHMLLAMWSAEFKSVNALLREGSKPENLEISPPVLLWDIVSTVPPIKPESPLKPWWKFW